MNERFLSGATVQFEQLRQDRETRNEMVINDVQMVHFGIILLANITTHFLPVAPYRASLPLLIVVTGSFAVRLGLCKYLRSQPRYRPARKYVLSSFDLAVFTAGPLLLGAQGAFPWLFLNLFAVCIYALLIVLSGLRYDTKVVAYNGVATVLLYVLVFTLLVPLDYRLAVVLVGLLTLSGIAVCTGYSVASLTQIHREAAMKEQLARFLSPELVEQVTKNPGLLQRKTEHRTATVIFADIRNFTQLSEHMLPERVVEFLNDFLDEMTTAIMEHQGMLDKYIGDAVMGVFGVPLATNDHALRALQAAVDMRDRLSQLNAKLERKGLPALSIGIGLHSGDLLMGAIGSTWRLDYTVIGDTVNVASRIEGMTRSYPVEILLSDATREAILDTIPLYQIATVHVRNRTQPLTLWSPDPLRMSLAGQGNQEASVALKAGPDARG